MRMDISNLVRDIIDTNPHIAALVVDRNGIIQFMNETYLKVLQLSRDKVLGKDIRHITPGSNTVKVIETGQPLLGYTWTVHGSQGIACSVPLFEDGNIVGAFAYSIFLDIWDKNLRDNVMYKLVGKQVDNSQIYITHYNFNSLIGLNQDFVNLKNLAKSIAQHEGVTILITGESGTGKELFAQSIHNHSQRSMFPFVRVNCASIPHSLLESELFGYADGAYTGARRGGKPGKFELAHNGTVFLDEIGEMPLAMQSKLLVFLQERIVERLGSNKPIKVNVRIIAATNCNLEKMIEENRFREDLYYRLNVGRLDIPPLRHRKNDIHLLVEHYLQELSSSHNIYVDKNSPELLQLLTDYNWPGNVRELVNVLERALILADLEKSSFLLPRHLSISYQATDPESEIKSTNLRDLKTLINQHEKLVINQVLRETNNDKVQAAKILGINLSSLYRKARKYGIDC
jgi:transcriptional regulator with PAS, ATPase and Fis domain